MTRFNVCRTILGVLTGTLPQHASPIIGSMKPFTKKNLISATAWLVALTGLMATLPVIADAATVTAGYKVAPYATGFAVGEFSDGVGGPMGLAFDAAGNLYVSDIVEEAIYKFGPGGGVAEAGTRLVTLAGSEPAGLAMAAGRLFCARLHQNDVVELDPTDGHVIRVVAAYLKCPSGLASDPISGDLFVSSLCSNSILRLADSSGYVPTVGSVYSSPGDGPDGLGFGSDGTLYATLAAGLAKIAGTEIGRASCRERVYVLV